MRNTRVLTFKTIDQSIAKAFLVCCFALAANTDSMAADDAGLGPRDAVEYKAEQPGEVAAEPPIEFSLGAGYRSDNLKWSEAGSSVNIRSELKWENLKIALLRAAARLNFHSGWSLRGALDYGSINSG